MTVQDVMTRDVVTVTSETTLKDVATLLTVHLFSGFPVVDNAGAVVGAVSESDILYKEREANPRRGSVLERLFRRESDELSESKLTARTAGEAMTSPAIVIHPRADVSRAAALIIEREINRLPVVDDGRLVGIITRQDLIQAFARSDEDITVEVEELVADLTWRDER